MPDCSTCKSTCREQKLDDCPFYEKDESSWWVEINGVRYPVSSGSIEFEEGDGWVRVEIPSPPSEMYFDELAIEPMGWANWTTYNTTDGTS